MKRFFPVLLLYFISCHFLVAQIPRFDSESAYRYLKIQCGFGPRYPGSEGHIRCQKFLVDELSKYADRVERQPFLYSNQKLRTKTTLNNLIAYFGNQDNPILLCAHWDTRPWADFDPIKKNRDKPILGANDGASGVAVLLEIARIMKENPPPVGVCIVLFDGEDSGTYGIDKTWCVGSRFFAHNLPPDFNPQYGILIDMIGDRDLTLPMEKNSLRYAEDLVYKVWTIARQKGLNQFIFSEGSEIIDDHLELIKVGIPVIDIIDFEYPYWHTLGDTEDKCSPESLGVVGTLLLSLIYEH